MKWVRIRWTIKSPEFAGQSGEAQEVGALLDRRDATKLECLAIRGDCSWGPRRNIVATVSYKL